MRENMLLVLDKMLSNIPLFILLGLFNLIIIENKTILEAIKQKKLKLLLPILKRTKYIVSGLILIVFSFTLVTMLFDALLPVISTIPYYEGIEPKGFWSTWKYHTPYVGLISVIGVNMAGMALLLSAGGKWLLNLAKLLLTITILYFVISMFVAYA